MYVSIHLLSSISLYLNLSVYLSIYFSIHPSKSDDKFWLYYNYVYKTHFNKTLFRILPYHPSPPHHLLRLLLLLQLPLSFSG